MIIENNSFLKALKNKKENLDLTMKNRYNKNTFNNIFKNRNKAKDYRLLKNKKELLIIYII